MKSYLKIAICAMSIVAMAVSCKEKEDTGGGGTPTLETVQKSWNAVFEGFTSSKAVLQSDLSITWSEDEAISVFSGKKNQEVSAESVSQDGKTAVFSGEVVDAKKFYALYPYNADASNSGESITSTIPVDQTLTAGAQDPAARFFVAKTEDENLVFKSVPGLIALKVKGSVASVKLSTSSDADRLAGKAKINTGTGRVTVVSGTNYVNLTGTIAADQTYYVSLIPGTYADLMAAGVNADGLTAEVKISEEDFVVEAGKVVPVEIDFTEADWILRPPTGQSYNLKSAEEVLEFVRLIPNPKEDVVDLTLSGADIKDEHIAKIADRVGSVTGNLVWDNVGATTTVGFFDEIACAKNITLKNCAALESAEGFAACTEIGGDLLIENCPKLGQGWPLLESVRGTFKLVSSSVLMGEGNSFAALKSVGGDFVVENMGENFTTFKGAALGTVNGNISITGNAGLADLSGLDRLTVIGGDIVILDNPNIPTLSDEVKGFCLVREYMNKGVVGSTANVRLGLTDNLIDIAVLPACDGALPGEPQSYTLNGEEEVKAFVAGASAKEIVNNLTIRGDVSENTFRSIRDRVERIKGTITLEELTWGNADGWAPGTNEFFEYYTFDNVFEGSIVLRNIAGDINPNGFQYIKEIKGDFIIENCPKYKIQHWEGSLNKLEKVGGDFRMINCAVEDWISGNHLKSLKEVGGDFELAGFQHLFFLDGADILNIGGDLIVRDCPSYWGLNGFANLSYVGGNVVISNYGKLPVRNGIVDNQDCIGICHLKDLQLGGYLSSTATVTVSKDGETLDFSTVQSCSAVYEEDKLAGNEKYPDPEDVTGWE